MSDNGTLRMLSSELRGELVGRILPYWMEQAIDEEHGGFVGYISQTNVREEDAPKGSILNARILWTFSAAARMLGDEAYRATADLALEYLRAHFIDPVHGGVYWMVDATGAPMDTRKHVYAQSFAIYALSEHARATRNEESLRQAVDIFRLIEEHAHDAVHGGYQEAFSREWALLDDVRLSEEDADERKSMNTHLHVLEAYTDLYRVWPDSLLRQRLTALVELFLDSIVDAEAGHVRPFFDEDWTPTSSIISYGHDIETSWLLMEAADVLGDAPLRARVQEVALVVAEAVREKGLDANGGLFNEVGPDGVVDTDKEWWPQAEAIVGFVNAHELTGRGDFLDAAEATWAFTKRHILDMEHGEWHRRVSRDGTLRSGREKVGPWKCPYHNARACLEVIARAGRAVGSAS